jgi:hypothetical protein
MRKVIYRNEKFEAEASANLIQTRDKAQELVDEWIRLGIGPVPHPSVLLESPKRLITETIDKMITVPEQSGPFQMNKEQYKATLQLPDTRHLLDLANELLRSPHAITPGLFILDEDNKISLDPDTVKQITEAGNMYSEDEDKIALFENLQTWADLSNRINEQLGGTFLRQDLWTNKFCQGRYLINDQDKDRYTISIDPDFLRTLL